MAEPVEIDVGPHGRTSGRAYLAAGHERWNATLVLAHGAGAPQHSRFMMQFAGGLAARGVDVLTFNFLYTEARRRIPDRADRLEACYLAAIDAARAFPPFARNRLFIGGKSMGGRIATQLAAGSSQRAVGIVLLGYPLHPPGKPERLRAAHLTRIGVPMLFIQGTKDPFGTPEELSPILAGLPADVTMHVVEEGDHSLAPPKRGPMSVDQVYENIQEAIVEWIRRRTGHTAMSPA